MSVWRRVQNKALYENVDPIFLKEALADLNIGLDESVKKINNAYGQSNVDAQLVYNNKVVSLGIVYNTRKGIEIIGDTWRSGIVGDNQADKLIDMISQSYQKVKLKKELERQGWSVNVVKKQDKITLECVQF